MDIFNKNLYETKVVSIIEIKENKEGDIDLCAYRCKHTNNKGNLTFS